jgi:aminoglycoside phosphotransferase (APT) family kinase protein
LSIAFAEDAHEWLRRSIPGATRHLEIRRMKGSTSSSVYLVECARHATTHRFVLRVLDNREWLADEPDLAEHEAAALVEAERAGLSAPRLVAYASDDKGFGAPVVLMSFIAGEVDLRPSNVQRWLGDLAGQLAAIHWHAAAAFPWHFRSWVDRLALAPPEWGTLPHVWQRAIDLLLGTAPESRPVFIHRDYHPTNVLWRAGAISGSAISGVVDWINACRGPAGVDVAHCRTNLAEMFGPDTADQFLNVYRQAADGFDYDPYWDVDSVLHMCIPKPSFYEPWQQFGLGAIAPEELQHRIEMYLVRVVARL